MNDTRNEGDLRAALLEISKDAPAVRDVLPAARRASRPRQRWLAPLAVAVAVVVAVVAVGIAFIDLGSSTDRVVARHEQDLVGVHWVFDRIGTQTAP